MGDIGYFLFCKFKFFLFFVIGIGLVRRSYFYRVLVIGIRLIFGFFYFFSIEGLVFEF